jgi:hypothetical protein
MPILKKIFWPIFFLTLFLKADSVSAFTLGETRTFNIDPSYDYAGRSSVSATLRQVGDWGLYYIENEWWNSLNATDAAVNNLVALNLLDEFDKTIHPRLTQIYGSEWSPGIDNELRVFILITPLKKNTGGYFNTLDEFSRFQIPASNEREIIYLNTAYLNSPLEKVFLAHEFQHMISFYQKEKLRGLTEDIWLNEARSEYASTLCGYDDIYEGSNLQRRVKEFLRNPSDSLTEWQGQTADYGPADIFMQYLVSRYGQQVLIKMVKAEAVGIESINRALKELGFTDSFADVFTNWTVANYINDCQLGQGQKYCYLNQDLTYERLHVMSTLSNFLAAKEEAAFSFADDIKDWAGQWYKISPVGSSILNLVLNFAGDNVSNFQIPVLIFSGSGTKSIRYLKLDGRQTGSDLILGFGAQVSEIVLILSNQTKTSGFSANEIFYPFSYTVKLTSFSQLPVVPVVSPAVNPVASSTSTSSVITPPVASPDYPDGSLIRAKNDYRVYVIKGKYKRWIQSPEILAAYPHFSWQNIIEVTAAQRDWYQNVWLIRAEGDYKIYEINGDMSKHWLNMSVQQFVNSGRSWETVFVVNRTERDLYKTGADVIR